MKRHILFFFILGLVFFIRCGKPTTPESLNPDAGGYQIISRLPACAYAQDIVKKDNLVYIAQGEGGLLIISVADPAHPQTLTWISEGVKGYSNNIAMKDSVVYLAAGTYGISVINVADPGHPVVTASNISMKPARGLHIMGNYLFAAISEQGVKIANIDDPTQPDIRGGMSTSGYAHGITNSADSNYLFVAGGEMGLSIFNISNFQQGFGNYSLTAWCDTPGYAESVTISDKGSIAFLACGTAGLQIIDYSDSSDLHIVGSYDGGGYAKKLIYKNNKIYMTAELGGLQIIDVSDVTKPALIGKVETQYALGLEMDEKYIYVADEEEGLVIISIPE
ncbi:MAG: hypothetical protein NTU44_16220 [Bacteroidetes bacterium]|nr:hypothetical protein [Bacteroidota bacterium]